MSAKGRVRKPERGRAKVRSRRSGVNDEADRERPLPTPAEPFRSLTERSTALAQSHQFEHVLGTSARPQRTALLDADPLLWDVPQAVPTTSAAMVSLNCLQAMCSPFFLCVRLN